MLRGTIIRWWTPRYLAYGKGPPISSKNTVPKRSVPSVKKKEVGAHRERGTVPVFQETKPNVEIRSSSLYITTPDERIQRLSMKSEELLRLCGTPSGREAEYNRACFTARRDIFGPLKELLPPPEGIPTSTTPTENPAFGSTSSSYRMCLIPDEMTSSPHDYVARQHASSQGQGPTPSFEHSSISLEDMVALLRLYDLIECEDGPLLKQLMDETRRFLFRNIRAGTPSIGAMADTSNRNKRGNFRVKLPFPDLLLVMSRLGIMEESTLQAIIGAPIVPSSDTPSGLPQKEGAMAERGLLFQQLALYTGTELVNLFVALHRFGLHQEEAFEKCVKEMRHRLWASRSSAGRFAFSMRTFVKHYFTAWRLKPDAHSSVGNVVHDVPFGEDATAMSTTGMLSEMYHLLPDPPEDTKSTPALLLETLTALSLSAFRRREVVHYFADVLCVIAAQEMMDNSKEDRQQLLVLSQQLLRATKLCEEMDMAHPLLAATLTWACSLSSKGVLVDGGEDSDTPSERLAYYDHVTADLIKVGHV